MTPAEHARKAYGNSLPELMDYYMDNGYIYSGPDAFALAMPHSTKILLGQDTNKTVDKCDCWFVQYASGDLRRLMEMLNKVPIKLEYIVFARDDGDNKVYNLEKFNVRIKT